MSDLWALPLVVGAAGAAGLLFAVKRLNDAAASLRDSMRPLRLQRASDSLRRSADRSL